VLIVIESALDADCEPLSTTRTVKLDIPAEVGVPLIVPSVDIVKPAGKDPEVTDQEYGASPPLAVSVTE